MKGNAKPSLYFSAYPLKAVESASKQRTGSPYLRAVLTAKPKQQQVTRARVFPMVNPYKNPYEENLDPVPARLTAVTRLPLDIELTEKKMV